MGTRFGFIGSIRHRGLLFGVDIVDESSGHPDRSKALKIYWRAWGKGLIMITFGKDGNVLRIVPPLNIEKKLMDEALAVRLDFKNGRCLIPGTEEPDKLISLIEERIDVLLQIG